MIFSRKIVVALTPVAAMGLSSCADPAGAFDDFTARSSVDSGSTGAGGSGASPGDAGGCLLPDPTELEGELLFSISAVISPETPVLLVMSTTAVANDDGIVVTFVMQAISATDRMTPVGPALPPETLTVAADGTFSANVQEVTIDGRANPITGTEIFGTIAFGGRFCSSRPPDENLVEFACGDVTGMLERPLAIPLEGSTFALQRVPPGGQLPSPVINCAMDPAATL